MYTLMNKNRRLADIKLSLNGHIEGIVKIYDKEAFPIGIFNNVVQDKDIIGEKLDRWWKFRNIPASRDDLSFFLQISGFETTSALAMKSLGLSLSDQYWIKPINSELQWLDVNFFTNDFSEDLGDIFFTHKLSSPKINPLSPDASCNGWLKKKWKIIESKRYLAKAGSAPFFQEPFNEVIASKIMTEIGVVHIDYELIFEYNRPLSLCPNFINENTEYVPAYAVCSVLPKKSGDSLYAHFLRCTEYLKIPNVQDYMDNLFIVDFLIENTDRHYGNFGFIRDVNSLKFLGAAPVFDSGTSLWCKSPIEEIGSWDICNPLMKTQREQLKFVKNWNIDIAKLAELEEIAENVLSQNKYIDAKRCDKVCKFLGNRARVLKNMIIAKLER